MSHPLICVTLTYPEWASGSHGRVPFTLCLASGLKSAPRCLRVVVVSVPEHEARSRSGGLFSADWWTAGRGWSGIAQWPNPAIVVFVVAAVTIWADLVDDPQLRTTLVGVGYGALVVWALDELFRGMSPIRRLMGAGVLIALLIHLLI